MALSVALAKRVRVFQVAVKEREKKFGSGTGNRTRVFRLRT